MQGDENPETCKQERKGKNKLCNVTGFDDVYKINRLQIFPTSSVVVDETQNQTKESSNILIIGFSVHYFFPIQMV
jgi:hypothetical protein